MAGERTLPGLGLTGFWDLGSDFKTGMDQNLLVLSVRANGAVASRASAAPGTPANGDVHIATTDWGGTATAHSVQVRDNGAWVEITPQEGWLMYDQATDEPLIYTGLLWDVLETGAAGGGVGVASGKLDYAKWTPVPIDYFTGEFSTPAGFTVTYPNETCFISGEGDSGSAFLKETVSGDFDRVYTVKADLPHDANAAIGVFIGDSTSADKSLAMVSTTNANFLVQNFSGTGFTSNGTNTGLDDLVGVETLANHRHYWRLTRVGTSVDAYFSTDGVTWIHVGDWTSTEHGIVTLDEIGVYLETASVSTSRLVQAVILGVDNGPQSLFEFGTSGTSGASGITLGTAITASRDLVNADFSGQVFFNVNSGSPVTLTVPPGLTGTEPVSFQAIGAGAVSFAAGAGVTIQSLGGSLAISGQYGAVSLVPKGSDVYALIGALA